MEEWKPVVGWEGVYEVSSLGRVKRVAPGQRTYVGKILRQQSDSCGYSMVGLSRNCHTKQIRTHILVAESFLGPRPPGLEVNHKDGNKTNAAFSNLEYVTRSENIRHAFHVTGANCSKGMLNGRAKLSDNQVLEIRRLYGEGTQSQTQIAVQFGVSQTTISKIVLKTTWS